MADPVLLKNNDNVRIFGSDRDTVWVARKGTPIPDPATVAGNALPAPWLPVGWLADSGIPFSLSVNIEKLKGHQGNKTVRVKPTETERGFSMGMLEDTPLTNKIYHGAGDPTLAAAGIARLDLPGGVDTVELSAVVWLSDGLGEDSVWKAFCMEEIQVGEREEIPHAVAELSSLGVSCEILGEPYILTNSPAFLEGLTVTP